MRVVSNSKKTVNQVENLSGSCFNQFVKYMGEGTLPVDKKKARVIIAKSDGYLLHGVSCI